MRTLLLVSGFVCAVGVQAQDLLYAQRGNPSALLVNPAADVDARVWLSLPSINQTYQTSFAAGDVLGGDLGVLWRQFPSESAGLLSYQDVGLFSLGFKTKKSTYWVGGSLNLDASSLVDRDLVGFALWGMKDANDLIDLNYNGNFNQTSAVVSARSNLHLGWQREFGKKLRLGATLNLSQILAHAELKFDSLGLRSTDLGNGFNELMLYSQGSVAAYSGGGLMLDLFDGSVAFSSEKLFSTSFATLDLGATYDLSKRWRLAGSIQGLGGGTAMAAEYHGFYGRRLQLSASYTQPLASSVAMRPSVSVQTTVRLAAGLALNLGTSSANMLPQPVTTANGQLGIGLPANMDRLNVDVGLHWMLYEKSYRENAKARRAANKAKRAAKKAESKKP